MVGQFSFLNVFFIFAKSKLVGLNVKFLFELGEIRMALGFDVEFDVGLHVRLALDRMW